MTRSNSGGTLRRLVVGVVATIGATVGFVLVYALPFEWTLGPSARWWEPLRRRVSHVVGVGFDERAGPRPVTEGEYAGALSSSLDATEHLLWEKGYVRNPFSRLKVRNDQPEDGSWAYRESPFSRRQLHLMLFCRDDGGVDVYAHEEPSSVYPLAGLSHFRGAGQNVAAGVARAQEDLPLDTRDVNVESVDGPWTVQRR